MPAVDPLKIPKAKTGGNWLAWNYVKAKSGGSWVFAKKAYAKAGGVWVEVWNARPGVVTGSGSSSAYDRITINGTVDANNFTATPKFYYRVKNVGGYTATANLTTITGDTATSVTPTTITGLAETTTYQYYLSASNTVGTDTGSVAEVTTVVNCDPAAAGWASSTGTNASTCDFCGTVTTVTYTKSGCTSYTVQTTSCGTWDQPQVDVTVDGVFYLWNGFFFRHQRFNICGSESGFYTITKCSQDTQYRVTFDFCSGFY